MICRLVDQSTMEKIQFCATIFARFEKSGNITVYPSSKLKQKAFILNGDSGSPLLNDANEILGVAAMTGRGPTSGEYTRIPSKHFPIKLLESWIGEKISYEPGALDGKRSAPDQEVECRREMLRASYREANTQYAIQAISIGKIISDTQLTFCPIALV